mgnify:CR=1 FL=1
MWVAAWPDRKRAGVHHTSATVAGIVVDLALSAAASPAPQVGDPSVGGGSFLIAAADRLDKSLPANREIASAKLYASEMLARVTDAAIQIHGGMGLMDDYPLERFWRDARVERIWDGTSEIQRHIISRDLLWALGA